MKMDFRGVVTAIFLLYLCNLGDCGVIRYRDEIQCNWVPLCYYTVENPGVCNIYYPYQTCNYVKVPYEEPNLSVPESNKPAPGNSAEELIPGETVVDRLKKELDLSEIELNARLREAKNRKSSQYNVFATPELRFNKEDEKESFSDLKNNGPLDKITEEDNSDEYNSDMYDTESESEPAKADDGIVYGKSLSDGKHVIISDIVNNLLSNEIANPIKHNNVQLDAASKIDLPVSVDTTPDSFTENGNGDLKINPINEANVYEKQSEPEKEVEKAPAFPLDFSLHRNFINAPINCDDDEGVDATGKCRKLWG